MGMERLIFHVDVNSAYLSWEAARRVAQGEGDLRLIPSAIGGDKDKRTGVILAKSIPAKAFHITTGEPVAAALEKCPQLVLAKPDFRLYKACSRAFMEICSRYAPVVEKFSIDECFLDMTGTDRMYPDPLAVAYAIRDAIRTELGFTVNIGVSRNKLLAKMASDFEKPDRVHTLFPEEIPEKFWPLPVGELFSVGSATAGKLNAMGIHTIGDLAHTPLPRLQAILGKKAGRHLHAYANGLEAGIVAGDGNNQVIRMANLSIVGSFKVNGVAKIHSELLKTRLVPEFYELWPEKFINITNGVTPRRWLYHANTPLAELISSKIGSEWITDLNQLQKI